MPKVTGKRLTKAHIKSVGELLEGVLATVPAMTAEGMPDLTGLSEEDQAKKVVGYLVTSFNPRIPGLLDTLSRVDPREALRIYLNLLEFSIPKLARTEQSGRIDHRHLFVPVERRDEEPVVEVAAVEVSGDGSTRPEG